MPALAVTTWTRSGAPIAPVRPPTLMIEPASLFLMASRHAFTQWNAPSRVTPMMCAPFLEGHVLDGLLPAQRGVVDEIVDAAEFLQRGLGHGVDGGRVDHVGDARPSPCRPCASISLTTASASARLLPHVDHDRGAACGKLQRHGAADAAAGAGDDGHAAGEFLVRHFVIPSARTDRSVRRTRSMQASAPSARAPHHSRRGAR